MQGFISSVGQTETSGGGATIPETASEVYYLISNNTHLNIDLRTGACDTKLSVRLRKMNTSTDLYYSNLSALLNKGFFQMARLGGTDTNSYYCPFITSWSLAEGSGVYFTLRLAIKNAMFWKKINTDGFYYGDNYLWNWNGNNNTTISNSFGTKTIGMIYYIKNSLNFPNASARSNFSPFQTVQQYNYTGCEVVGTYNERPVSFVSVISPPKSSITTATEAIACWCNGCGWIDNGSFAKFERCYIDSNNVMHVSAQIYQPASDTYTSTWIALDSFSLYERY